MVLCNCFLQQRTTCGILLSLVCALVDCPRGKYEFRNSRSQGFLARRGSIQFGYRPVCCSFSDGTCNGLPCSTSSVRLCVCVRSTNADTSVGDICYGFPMQLSFGGCSSMCMWS